MVTTNKKIKKQVRDNTRDIDSSITKPSVPVGTQVRNDINTQVRLGITRRAITTEAATANNHITCNLYNIKSVEVTTGDEADIEVYCSIIRGTALNAALPRLENNDDLFVTLLPFSSTESRWFCLSLFTGSEVCS